MSGHSLVPPETKKKARIEIIPLIDVIFFLLATFVLFTLSLDKIQSVDVQLPVASNQPGPAAELIVRDYKAIGRVMSAADIGFAAHCPGLLQGGPRFLYAPVASLEALARPRAFSMISVWLSSSLFNRSTSGWISRG